MGAIHRHITVGKIINTLRAIEADRPDRIAPELHERLRYTLATSAGRSTPRDAYSPFVARALRDAARADVEAMFRRLGADDRTDEGDPVIARADVEAIIARQGFIVADQPELKSLYFMRMRRNCRSARSSTTCMAAIICSRAICRRCSCCSRLIPALSPSA
jgi:hypothetical protein